MFCDDFLSETSLEAQEQNFFFIFISFLCVFALAAGFFGAASEGAHYEQSVVDGRRCDIRMIQGWDRRLGSVGVDV